VFDIVFISYNEPNADVNYERLKSRFPTAKRVHGVKGIHQAHIAAAKKCFTPMFWVVDADAIILDSFNFDYKLTKEEHEIVHVWRSRNPVNGLEYGYGGVKLLPKKLTLNMDVTSTDMTTSISPMFKAMEEVSNITEFNTDPFSTWRSAFRECCKLASKTIQGQVSSETIVRLKMWCSAGQDAIYGDYAIRGALDGRYYGEENAADSAALSLINDFDWLKNRFEQTRQP
jgi:hypothetical protein